MNTATYNVTGMTCGHCENHVKEELAEIGLTDIEVSHETGILTVNSETEIDDAKVIEAVDEAGYEAVRA